MAEFDEELEQRVWQRVRGQAPQQSLQTMAAAERGSAAVYLMLSRMMQGRKKELLRQLYHREQNHGRFLKGISVLRDGKALAVRTVPPEGKTPENLLRRCYAGSLKAAEEYASRSGDREYGPVFAKMAREEWENCAMILEILGI